MFILVASARAQTLLEPAEFVVSNLTITQEVFYSFMGDINIWNFKITVNVTNIGEQEGSHKVDLKVDGDVIESGIVTLGEGETTLITFDVRRGVGSYTVEVDGLTGSFVVLNTLKPDEVKLSELEALGRQALVHDDEGRPIIEGEYVIFNVLVENIGEVEGTYTVEFKVRRLDRQTLWDLETIDTLNVTLAAGRGRRAFTEYEALNTGTYQVVVGDLTDTFTVRAPLEPAEFEFSNLSQFISIEEDMDITFFVDVSNVGDIEGTYQVVLILTGGDILFRAEYITDVTLPGGASEEVPLWIHDGLKAGAYQVEVEGLTGSFTVVKPEPSFWDKIPGFPYESIILGLIAVIIILWRARNL